MLVYCGVIECKWNDGEGMCNGPVHPTGQQFLSLYETLGGEAMCSDLEYREEDENESED